MRWGWRNGGLKFVAWEHGRNPEKTLPRVRFVHHESHMDWPRRELGTPAVAGESKSLRHGAGYNKIIIIIIIIIITTTIIIINNNNNNNNNNNK